MTDAPEFRKVVDKAMQLLVEARDLTSELNRNGRVTVRVPLVPDRLPDMLAPDWQNPFRENNADVDFWVEENVLGRRLMVKYAGRTEFAG